MLLPTLFLLAPSPAHSSDPIICEEKAFGPHKSSQTPGDSCAGGPGWSGSLNDRRLWWHYQVLWRSLVHRPGCVSSITLTSAHNGYPTFWTTSEQASNLKNIEELSVDVRKCYFVQKYRMNIKIYFIKKI